MKKPRGVKLTPLGISRVKQTFQSRLLISYQGDACSERQTTNLKNQFLEGGYIVYEILKKYVFKCFLKVKIEICSICFRLSGRAFHAVGQENENPRLPNVSVWMDGVTSCPTVADLRRDRPHTVETGMHERVR